MSMRADNSSRVSSHAGDFLALSAVGRRLEALRLERGVSKQHLARRAGMSRQQIWRVMTGKSELTETTRARLGAVLQVDPGLFASDATNVAPPVASHTLREFLADARHLEQTLRTLPGGADGMRLKRQLLDGVEDLALESSLRLPSFVFEARRRVLAGDL